MLRQYLLLVENFLAEAFRQRLLPWAWQESGSARIQMVHVDEQIRDASLVVRR